MGNRLFDIFNIAQKTVLITGASGFFGRYMSRTFLEVDANVVLLSRSRRLDEQVKAYQEEFGRNRATGLRVDFYDRQALGEALQTVTRDFRIDVLINNAYDLSPQTGFNTTEGTLEHSDVDQWSRAFESGICWAVQGIQLVGEQFRQAGRGSIINVSSMYGLVAPSPRLYEGTDFLNPPTYSVVKAGLLGLTRYVASFWGRYGVRCNAIVPGPFPNREGISANSVQEHDPFIERLERRTALGRVGHPTELAGALVFLASDASSYVTGHALTVDGGWTII